MINTGKQNKTIFVNSNKNMLKSDCFAIIKNYHLNTMFMLVPTDTRVDKNNLKEFFKKLIYLYEEDLNYGIEKIFWNGVEQNIGWFIKNIIKDYINEGINEGIKND